MKRRRQGRPPDKGVGRDYVIAAARNLLEELPPGRVSLSLIAREANVDPALIRYYFRDRAHLLLAVVQDMLSTHPEFTDPGRDALKAMRERFKSSHRFTRSAKHMHRLMIDELAESKSDEVKDALSTLNLQAIKAYEAILGSATNDVFRKINPLFLHLTVVGIFDFFVSAEPIIRAVTPAKTNIKKVEAEFEKFVTDLLLNGLLKR